MAPAPLRRLALPLVAAALAAACSGIPASPAPPALPAGFTRYDGGPLGFRLGLAPGWHQAGDRAEDGVTFTDQPGTASLLVHVGGARSRDLSEATGAVLFDLTAGGGVAGGGNSATTLAGRPARRARGGFD